MEPDARYTLVGAVVLILVTAVVAASIWITRVRERGEYTLFGIDFREHSLSGLQVDSWVTMRGIKIGSVDSWAISRRDIELVRVIVRVDRGTPIKTDTRAVINRNLLTGIANIDLIGSTQDSELLVEKLRDEPYPLIPEGASSLETLRNTLPELMERASDMIRRTNRFLSKENEDALTTTLHNLQLVSQRFADGEGEALRALKEISSLAESLRGVTDNLNTRTTEVARSLQNSFDSITQNLALATRSLSSTLERFDEPRALISGPNPDAFGPGEGVTR